MRLKSAIVCWSVAAMMVGVLPSMAFPNDMNESPHAPSNGKHLFARYCAGCHGPEGKGDGYKLLGPDPANLARSTMKGKSDAALLNTIHEGKPNMPSWKVRLSDKESQSVLAYVRTLAK